MYLNLDGKCYDSRFLILVTINEFPVNKEFFAFNDDRNIRIRNYGRIEIYIPIERIL